MVRDQRGIASCRELAVLCGGQPGYVQTTMQSDNADSEQMLYDATQPKRKKVQQVYSIKYL